MKFKFNKVVFCFLFFNKIIFFVKSYYYYYFDMFGFSNQIVRTTFDRPKRAST